MMNLIAKIGEKMAESAVNSASWPFCYQSSEPDASTNYTVVG